MCGFFGLIYGSSRPGDKALENAGMQIAYRGRDQSGIYRDERCYFAHYRLSIIDLENGNQPMRDSTGRYIILFNGELYNYLELKKYLESKGHQFITKSDTEVFLTGTAFYGSAFLKKAEGMFAAAVWDTRCSTLMLIKDPLGKKPLYVWEMPDGGLAFASGIGSFKVLPGWKGELDQASIIQFIHSGFIPAPLAIYKNVRKVMHGHMETFSCDKQWKREEYDYINFSKANKVSDDEEILHELRRAFQIRLRSDVPLGMTFSGGVDSGLLGCLARDLDYNISLFNIDYEDADNQSPERRNARIAAERLGFDLTENDFVPETIFTGLNEAYHFYDEPCSQLPLVYCYQIFKTIRNHSIKVILTGNGGDELFFGYNGNRRIRVISELLNPVLSITPACFLPKFIRTLKKNGWADFLAKRQFKSIESLSKAMKWNAEDVSDASRNYLQSYRHLVDLACFTRYSDFVLWQNLYYNGAPSNYLVPDIGGMQAQIEIRSPFLDWRFIKKVSRLPERLRIGSYFSDSKNKAVLKRLYAKRLGHDLAYDKKRGMAWNIRWDMWIIHEPQIRKLFEDSLGLLDHYGMNSSWFREHFDRYCHANTHNASGGSEAMAGFMLALWLKKEFEGKDSLSDWLKPAIGFRLEKGIS